MREVKNLKDDENGKNFIARLLRKSEILSSGDDSKWQNTLDTMLRLQNDDLFSSLTLLDIYTEMVAIALAQARFPFAQSIFYPRSGTSPFSVSSMETLVMNAAQDFFDNDEQGNRNHGFLRQSRTCCSLLSSSIPAIKAHLNLIEATHTLITDYQLQYDGFSLIMPIQIRLHYDRIKLIKLLLESHPEVYSKPEFLDSLIHKLLGDESKTDRNVALLKCYSASAALILDNRRMPYRIIFDVLNIIENSEDLILEVYPELYDVVSGIVFGCQVGDYMDNSLLLSRILHVYKTIHLNNWLSLWKKCELNLSLIGLSPEIQNASPKEAFFMLDSILATRERQDSPGNLDDSMTEFCKPVGSSLGDGYRSRAMYHGNPLCLDTRMEILKIQNSLRNLD